MPLKEQKLLIIAYKFPPVRSIGAIRNYNVAREFSRHFRQVKVLTTGNRSFLSGQPLPCHTSFDTEEAVTMDYRAVAHLFTRKQRLFTGDINRRNLLAFLARLKDTFPFNLLLDEGSLVYILSAVIRGYRMMKRDDIRYLYSSFRPYADHIVAWILKGFFPRAHWIADFRDPHVDLNRNNVFFPALQHWFNRRIIARADTVTAVSRGLADYLGRYGREATVLRNGINPTLSSLGDSRPASRFTIAYTGSIYRDKQTPEPLFAALRELLDSGTIRPGKIRLRYAGKDKSIWDKLVAAHGLSAISRSTAIVPLEESMAIQNSSHLNLLLSWSGPYITGILTGKLYEYLAAGKPVLAVINGSRDEEMEGIFHRLNAGEVIYTPANGRQARALKDFLLAHYARWEQGQPPPSYSDEVEEFYWGRQMDRFVEGLEGKAGWIPE